MTTVVDLIQNLQSVNIQSEVESALEKTDDSLVEKIRDQLYSGIDATGGLLSPSYRSGKYARLKHEMNPKPGLFNPDLKLTGLFYNEMSASIANGSILFSSDVSYAGKLEKKYTEKILEPTEESLDTYTEDDFYPELTKRIEEKTGLSFQ